MFQNILLQKERGIAIVTLNRPEKLNLLTIEMISELGAAIKQLKGDEEIGVVLIMGAAGGVFSAGVDVKEMRELRVSTARAFIRRLHDVLYSIRKLDKPVIAAISGYCLGGGLELALACDLRIAADNAQMGLPEIKVGVPSVIEAALLVGLIGIGKTKELVLTGDSIDASEAERIGLVNKVVPRGELKSAAVALAEKILSNSPLAVKVQKEVANKWMSTDLETAIEDSINSFALCFGSEEPKEAMTAFLEKRKPRFKGAGRG